MPTTERLAEVNIFFNRWENTPREEFKQEFASYVMESRGIPDLYSFPIDDEGNLLSASGRRIKSIISRAGYIGYTEDRAFDAIESWIKDNKSKDEVIEEIMWVSPPYRGVYQDLKVVISSIKGRGREKVLFNQSIIFNFDQAQALRFTRSLTEFSKNYPMNAALEDIRAAPLILNSEQPTWISVLEKIINDDEVWEYIRSGKAVKERERALEQSELVYRVRYSSIQYQEEAKEMTIAMLGDKPTSCPPTPVKSTAFQIFSQNSLKIEGQFSFKDADFCRNCPVCEEEINCVVRAGQSCPKCGAVKRCG